MVQYGNTDEMPEYDEKETKREAIKLLNGKIKLSFFNNPLRAAELYSSTAISGHLRSRRTS